MASRCRHPKRLYVCSLIFMATCHSLGEQLVLPEGKEHSILCTAPAVESYLITWVANGGPAGEGFVVGEEELVDDGMKGKRIVFTATPGVNNTNLKCVVTDLVESSNSFESLEITIVIQGLLSAPGAEYYMRDEAILFIWSPPFTHDISGIEHDISHYIISIHREGSSTDTVNTTDTKYVLESEDCQLHQYQVEIAAVNVVGVGERYISPSFTLEGLSITDCTVDISGNYPVVHLKIQTNCPALDIVFHVELIPEYSGSSLNISKVSTSNQMTLTLSSREINFKDHYKATVRIQGALTFQQHLTFSTFDVQSVEVKEYSGYVHVICHFAMGSTLKDCRIVFIPLSPPNTGSQQTDCQYVSTASRAAGSSEAAAVVVLPNGDYRVEVFDGEPKTENPAHSAVLSISYSLLEEGSVCTQEVNQTRTEIVLDDCDCNSSISVPVAVTLAVLAIVITVASTFITLLLFCSKKSCKKCLSTKRQQKYDMDDNPVYGAHTKASQNMNSSAASHHYETVVTAAKDSCSYPLRLTAIALFVIHLPCIHYCACVCILACSVVYTNARCACATRVNERHGVARVSHASEDAQEV